MVGSVSLRLWGLHVPQGIATSRCSRQGVLEELVDEIGHPAILLTAFHDVSVLCVGECHAPLSPPNRLNRGQRRPLFQGAGSKVILAHLLRHRLKGILPATRRRSRRLGWAARGAISARPWPG